MNNEPVAWLFEKDNGENSFITSKNMQEYYASKSVELIPLYTHPAKTLTEKEIEVLWEKHCPFDLTGGIAFARAILRKAQEK